MSHTFVGEKLDTKDYEEIVETINQGYVLSPIKVEDIKELDIESLKDYLYNKLIEKYDKKVIDIPKEVINEFEKAIILRVIDMHWIEHINTMSLLREGIGLRGYAQENPLRAYTKEGFDLFDSMLTTIDNEATSYLIRAEIRQNTERVQVIKGEAVEDRNKIKKAEPKRVNKIGRNDPCPCGSGKKYKQCCGK